ncbi:MAG: hypothetical protein HZB24_15420 [Desulfobacterales bacterium]|nr:hypothetical protein [Desulfobacterales bacterium]
MRAKSFILLGLIMTLVWGVSPAVSEEIGRTPPRLSFVDGEVSFYRPGAPDWVEAQVNTPLAPGDQVYTGSPGNIELQIGARAYVRGWANTQIGLENHEPDFLQFKVTSGYVAFDLRDLPRGNTVEVDTPNAAFTINNPGYCRVNVDGERTTFITRKGGSAVATPVGGRSLTIAPSEELVLDGTSDPAISSYAAPPLDVWDQWNYDRTNDLIEAVSARYVSPEAYGTDDLDRNGTWRVVPTYGSVWIPGGVPAGWAPYSDGTWIMDPYYGWTWVDRAPWGWAPYHYGRWVSVSGYWAWAPGPVLVRPVYAPALVAFMGGPGLSVSMSCGSAPTVGWVALGWGEPCVPWWGHPGFIHRPWWGGWGGPHMVNDVVVHHGHVVHVDDIHHYHHMKMGRGVMAVQEKYFGRGPMHPTHVDRVDPRHLQLNETVSRKHVTPASYAPHDKQGHRPPQESFHRPVVATRRPHVEPKHYTHMQEPGQGREQGRERIDAPMTRLVAAPKKGGAPSAVRRPAFGQGEDERPITQRGPNTPPGVEQRNNQREIEPGKPAAGISGERRDGKESVPGMIQGQQRDAGQPSRPALPGRPANALSPQDRERMQQSRIAPSEQSTERRTLEDVRNGKKGQDRLFQQRIQQPSQRQVPSGGGDGQQQRFFQQRIEQVPRVAPSRPAQNVPGNSGGQPRVSQPRQEQQRIAPPTQNAPNNSGGGQQRSYQQQQQEPAGNRSFQRN